jgi:hypothetical protein
MYTIEVLKSDSYQLQKISKGNFERDSSFHFSRAGVVIHSGEHRSTAFIPAETELHSVFRYWIKQEQKAINGFIVACVEGLGDEQCHENACRVSRPEWTFHKRTRKGFESISACRRDGKLTLHFSADSWQTIHYLTRP